MDTKTFLNDSELAAVTAFVANPTAFEAVKKVMLFSIYGSGVLTPGEPGKPMFNWALSITNNNSDADDVKLGQLLRAQAYAVNNVESAFDKLKEFQPTVEKKDTNKNPAL